MKIILILLILSTTVIEANHKHYINKQTQAQISKDLNLFHSIKQKTQTKSLGRILLVGGEPNGCDFDNIQDAIDNATSFGSDEIRIASNSTYVENLIIDNIDITMIGGYDSCFNAGQTGPSSQEPSDNRINIDGSNASLPVLRITGASLRNTVVLKNLSFKNGTGIGLQTGGGINAFDANTQVLLDNVFISGNSNSGLAIIGGASNNTDIVMIDTLISNNSANIGGGGIYCEGEDASIVIGTDSGVIFNQVTNASGKGGGAYITSGCSFSMYSAGMVSNTAKDGGGGIFAEGGAQINLIGRKVCNGSDCLGDNIRPVRFNANRGDSDASGQGNGGAIYINSSSTLVNMSQVWIDDNSAFNGGAISIHDSAQLYIQRFSKTCWNSDIDDKCNLFESNFASSSSGKGGAIYNDDSVILINQTYLENNRADFGTAVYATGESAVAVIDGSIFNHNGNGGITYQDKFVVGATRGAEYLILHSTFADNHATESVFNVSSLLNSELTLKNSIVHDSSSGNVLNSNSLGITEFECVLAHDISSIDGFSLFVGDPEFINRDNGDYHINASISPAIDLCSATSGSKDIDADLRGWDDPTVPNQDNNVNAIFDAGADESFDNDIIFASGFES